jgi:hypothetical protein
VHQGAFFAAIERETDADLHVQVAQQIERPELADDLVGATERASGVLDAPREVGFAGALFGARQVVPERARELDTRHLGRTLAQRLRARHRHYRAHALGLEAHLERARCGNALTLNRERRFLGNCRPRREPRHEPESSQRDEQRTQA